MSSDTVANCKAECYLCFIDVINYNLLYLIDSAIYKYVNNIIQRTI